MSHASEPQGAGHLLVEGGKGEAEQGQEQGEDDPRGDEQDHDGEGGVFEGHWRPALGEELVVDVQVDALRHVAPVVTQGPFAPDLDALPQSVIDPVGEEEEGEKERDETTILQSLQREITLSVTQTQKALGCFW